MASAGADVMAGLSGRALSASPVRTLLAGAIDYAGLFPPAALPMSEAVRNYAAYRQSEHAWALGRFVVPAARLGEFAEVAAGASWGLSVIAGVGGVRDWATLAGVGPRAESFELSVRSPDEIESAAAQLPGDIDVFYEIPIERDPPVLIASIARVRGKAKVRTGGVTRAAFPATAHVARFLIACARANVAFKATAGLHHPLRGTYRLTYEPDSPSGEMLGFVNVLLAAGFARTGLDEAGLVELLEERNARSIRTGRDAIEWRGRRLGVDALGETRSTLALSFGSCSFREPIEELEALGLL